MTDMTTTPAELHPCDRIVVEKAVGGRCAMCYQCETKPGVSDCTGGDRFAVQFGAAGGVVLCQMALNVLATRTGNLAGKTDVTSSELTFPPPQMPLIEG